MKIIKFYMDKTVPTVKFYIERFLTRIVLSLVHTDFAKATCETFMRFYGKITHKDIAKTEVRMIARYKGAMTHTDLAKTSVRGIAIMKTKGNGEQHEKQTLRDRQRMIAKPIAHKDIALATLITRSIRPYTLADLCNPYGNTPTLSDFTGKSLQDISYVVIDD